jgi:hypothetical protein
MKEKINKTEVGRQLTDSSLLLPHLENPIGRQNVAVEVFYKPNAIEERVQNQEEKHRRSKLKLKC